MVGSLFFGLADKDNMPRPSVQSFFAVHPVRAKLCAASACRRRQRRAPPRRRHDPAAPGRGADAGRLRVGGKVRISRGQKQIQSILPDGSAKDAAEGTNKSGGRKQIHLLIAGREHPSRKRAMIYFVIFLIYAENRCPR